MGRVYLGPISLVLVLEKLLMFCVWIVVNFYVFDFFVFPCYESDLSSRLFINMFVLYWVAANMIWIHSYVYVSWLDPGSVKAEIGQFKNPELVYAELSHLRKCDKCGVPKPYRAHHCSQCKKCYVRFDHHCPTVGNCIAYHNAQPFAVYLSYGALILFTTSVVSGFAWVFASPLRREITGFICVIVGILSFMLMSFAYNTVSGLWSDETTLERLYRMKTNQHRTVREDLGPIWGTQKWKWFVAHPPEVNGLVWANSLSRDMEMYL